MGVMARYAKHTLNFGLLRRLFLQPRNRMLSAHVSSEEETEDLSSQVLASGLFVVHDSARGSHNNVPGKKEIYENMVTAMDIV